MTYNVKDFFEDLREFSLVDADLDDKRYEYAPRLFLGKSKSKVLINNESELMKLPKAKIFFPYSKSSNYALYILELNQFNKIYDKLNIPLLLKLKDIIKEIADLLLVYVKQSCDWNVISITLDIFCNIFYIEEETILEFISGFVSHLCAKESEFIKSFDYQISYDIIMSFSTVNYLFNIDFRPKYEQLILLLIKFGFLSEELNSKTNSLSYLKYIICTLTEKVQEDLVSH